ANEQRTSVTSGELHIQTANLALSLHQLSEAIALVSTFVNRRLEILLRELAKRLIPEKFQKRRISHHHTAIGCRPVNSYRSVVEQVPVPLFAFAPRFFGPLTLADIVEEDRRPAFEWEESGFKDFVCRVAACIEVQFTERLSLSRFARR